MYKSDQEIKLFTKNIIQIDTIEINSNKNGEASWPLSEYEKANKSLKNIISRIESFLSSKLSLDQRKYISFKITSSIRNQYSHLSINLSLNYVDSFDFDIDSFYNESKNVAATMLKTINLISNEKEIDLNKLTINEHKNKSSKVENGVVTVPAGMASTIYKIIESRDALSNIKCVIGDKEIKLNISKTRQPIIRSHNSKIILGFIYRVDDDSNTVSVKVDKAKKHFTFNPALRKKLLTAQLNIKRMEFEVKTTYQHIKGKETIKGGHVIQCEIDAKNEQLSCLMDSD
tara:strand:- start:5972 stop:6832 length:861 start_codon:yes stop_codon:yes gene_type:complete